MLRVRCPCFIQSMDTGSDKEMSKGLLLTLVTIVVTIPTVRPAMLWFRCVRCFSNRENSCQLANRDPGSDVEVCSLASLYLPGVYYTAWCNKGCADRSFFRSVLWIMLLASYGLHFHLWLKKLQNYIIANGYLQAWHPQSSMLSRLIGKETDGNSFAQMQFHIL